MRTVVEIAIIALLLSFSASIGANVGNPSEAPDSPARVKLPLPTQLEQRQEEFQTRLAELQLAFAQEQDAEAALELQRKITAHKLNFEIDVYRLQLERFLMKGDSKYAEELQAAIDALEEKMPVVEIPELEEEGQ